MYTILRKVFYFFSIVSIIIFSSIFLNRFLTTKFNLVKTGGNINKLIIGASRFESGLNDEILINSLNISEFRESLLYTFIKLRAFVEANPKIDTVFLSIDSRTLDFRRSDMLYSNRYTKLKISRLIHLMKVDEFKRLMINNSENSLKGVANASKHSLIMLKKIFVNKAKPDINIAKLGGFKSIDKIIKKEDFDYNLKQINNNDENYNFSLEETKSLLEIINYCRSNNLTLFLINMPVHKLMKDSYEYRNEQKMFNTLRKQKFSDEIYLDFTSEVYPDSCYADLIHLNKHGAKLFSEKLNNILSNDKLLEQFRNY